jgi:chromate transporter
VAGSCFILPASLIVTAFAWTYTRYSSVPEVTGILYGVKPVIIAVVLQALWGLGKAALKTKVLWAVAGAGIALGLLGVNELLILASGGVIVGIVQSLRGNIGGKKHAAVCIVSGSPFSAIVQGGAGIGVTSVGLWPLLMFFLKVGSVLYGSGYVLLAFLRADLVERWHWLTETQLLDAVAVGQVTPGPVFTTATFIGYMLGGPAGALASTVGIFLPAFAFVAVSGPLIPWIRRSPTAGAILDGLNAASLSLMFVVTWHLGRAAIVDLATVLLALISAALLLRFNINSAWLVLGGACAGLLIHWGAWSRV